MADDDVYMFIGIGMPSAERGKTGYEPNDFSQAQIDKINFTDLPVCRKHAENGYLGKITHSFTGKTSGNKYIIGELDAKDPAAKYTIRNDILSGDLSELSATHFFDAKKDEQKRQIKLLRVPLEVSFVRKGNRDGCKVLAVFPKSKLSSILKDHIIPQIPREVLAEAIKMSTQEQQQQSQPMATEPTGQQQQQSQQPVQPTQPAVATPTPIPAQQPVDTLLNTEVLKTLSNEELAALVVNYATVSKEKDQRLQEELKVTEQFRKQKEEEKKKVIDAARDQAFNFMRNTCGEEAAKQYNNTLAEAFNGVTLEKAEQFGRAFTEIIQNSNKLVERQPQMQANWNAFKTFPGQPQQQQTQMAVPQQQQSNGNNEYFARLMQEADKLRTSGGPMRTETRVRYDPIAVTSAERKTIEQITNPKVEVKTQSTSISYPVPQDSTRIGEYAKRNPLDYHTLQSTTPASIDMLEAIATGLNGPFNPSVIKRNVKAHPNRS